MSGSFPETARGGAPDGEHPRLEQRPLSHAEERARWEVRAAQWRAREIAEVIFGGVSDTSLLGIRARGEIRGLLRLDVPWTDLPLHRAREERFLAAAQADPILARVPLLYVFSPDSA